jgi:hypothetical protein
MKISSKNFRVQEEDEFNLEKWPTKVDPVYKSKEQCHELLREHVSPFATSASLQSPWEHKDH